MRRSDNRKVCPDCKSPIVLVPSAEERARKFGGSPSDYTKLFPVCTYCLLKRLGRTTNPRS